MGRARAVSVVAMVGALLAGGGSAIGEEPAWTARGSVLVSIERGSAPSIALCSWFTPEAEPQGLLGYLLRLPEGLDTQQFTLAGVDVPSAPGRVGPVVRGVVFDVALYGEDPGTCLDPPLTLYEGQAGSPTRGMIPVGARYALVTRPTVSRSPHIGGCYTLPPLCVSEDTELHVSRSHPHEFLFTVDRTEKSA